MCDNIYISAVIPTFNRERTICRAIDSILSQTYLPKEIIIIDDGSTDRTRERFKKNSHKIRYIYQRNEGVSSARNRGILESKYDWIAFLDSDDYWLPDHLENLKKAIERTNGSAHFYFSDVLMKSAGNEQSYWGHAKFEIKGDDIEYRDDASDWAMMKIQPILLQASVIKRKTYLRLGLLPEKLITREDTLLIYRFLFLYPACAVSGIGTIKNIDKVEKSRLVLKYDSTSDVYWDCTKIIFMDLLNCKDNFKKLEYKYAVNQLINAHLSHSRILIKNKKILKAIKSIMNSIKINPFITFKSMFIMAFLVIINRYRNNFKTHISRLI